MRRKKRLKPKPEWTKAKTVELRGKAAFLGCVVDPISTQHGTRRWMLVVPGQSYGRIVASHTQRYRTERSALIAGIRWTYKYVYLRKDDQ